MDYEIIYDDTKDNLEKILLKLYADFVESKVKDLLTKNVLWTTNKKSWNLQSCIIYKIIQRGY